MATPHVYRGTAEEIVTQIRLSQLSGKLRAVIMPENGVEPDQTEIPNATLAERLQGRVGRFDFGDAHLSEKTGEKFADLLLESHEKEQL